MRRQHSTLLLGEREAGLDVMGHGFRAPQGAIFLSIGCVFDFGKISDTIGLLKGPVKGLLR